MPDEITAVVRNLGLPGFTVICLILSLFLVVFGTLAQVDVGAFAAQQAYFNSWLVYADFGSQRVAVFPGGLSIAAFWLTALVCSGIARFTFFRNNPGLLAAHAGVILLLLGQVVTQYLSEETVLPIGIGETKAYAENRFKKELAIWKTENSLAHVVSVPFSLMLSRGEISSSTLPVTIKVNKAYPNAKLAFQRKTGASDGMHEIDGVFRKLVQAPVALGDGETNFPGAEIEFKQGAASLGRWIVSTSIQEPQTFSLNGVHYSFTLRDKRQYFPFDLTLKKFTHEVYPGTQIPRNFASLVALHNPTTGESRAALIYMNHPLRYQGFAFYQASFGKNDTLSVLQVVRNPVWLTPYIACFLVVVGLLIDFRTRFASGLLPSPSPSPSSDQEKIYPTLLVVFAASLYLLSPILSGGNRGPFDLSAFGRLPVLNGGRVKPIDTVARSSLLILSGRQTLYVEGEQRRSATEWLLDVLFAPERADKYEVFRIDSPDVLGLLGIEQTNQTRFAFNVLKPHLAELEKQAKSAQHARQRHANAENLPFQTAIVNLHSRIALYQRLQNTLQAAGREDLLEGLTRARDALDRRLPEQQRGVQSTEAIDRETEERLISLVQQCKLMSQSAEFRPLARPEMLPETEVWQSLGGALLSDVVGGDGSVDVLNLLQLPASYRRLDAGEFNQAVRNHSDYLSRAVPAEVRRASAEMIFNRLAPFYRSMSLYIVALLLFGLFALFHRPYLRQSAFVLIIVAFIAHSAGLLFRVLLQGRPPVTNLYSSAVFVGWGAVLCGLIVERVYRGGTGLVVSAVIGFITLIVAHHLSLEGDTLEMMRAVLDSNFWLATHVVTITIGYSSTLLCGMVGTVFLLRRAFDRTWNHDTAAVLCRTVYGLLCASVLLTFLGTVLGGIWADQSWGRFWGWDPKENGALLIVLWILLILHARAGRLISDRLLMALVVFGNIVTALAWFGVNMLNVGLHTYGYVDRAAHWLAIFCLSQLAIMALAVLRPRNCRADAGQRS